MSSDKELSSNLVNKIYQDSHGYVWICTENGLNKTDGSKVTVYRHETNNPYSIKSNYIQTFFEDSKGRHWVGAIKGVMSYDRKTDRFSEVVIYFGDQKLISAHVTSIQELKSGKLILGTSGHGIFEYSEEAKMFIPFSSLRQDDRDYFEQSFLDSFGNLWIWRKQNEVIRISSDEDLTSFSVREIKPDQFITSIAQMDDGRILISFAKGGIAILNSGSGRFEMLLDDPNLTIKTLYKDRMGEILVGLDGGGLWVLDSQNKRLIPYKTEAIPISLSHTKVHALMEDDNQNLWIGLFQKGVVILPAHKNEFQYYGHNSVQNNIIGDNCIMSITQDRNRQLWIGTDNNGLFRLDPTTKRSVHFPYQSGAPKTTLSLLEDSYGTLWGGTFYNGLVSINKANGRASRMAGVPSERVFCLLQDDRSMLWIGTHGAGIYLLDLRTNEVKPLTDDAGSSLKLSLPNKWVNCFYQDSFGCIWVGTYGGLGCFDTRKNSFVRHKLEETPLLSLPIYSICERKSGEIAFGSSEGLFLFNRKKGLLRHLTTLNGLSDNTVCSITEDEGQNLWITTNFGLSRFSSDGRFTNYYKNDGIQGNEFSKNARYYASDGTLYLGGMNGITAFVPEQIKTIIPKAEVRITDFYLYDKAVQYGDKSGSYSIVNQAIADASTFSLAYYDNTFSVDFSIFDFINPERITFQYRINELKSNWINTSPRSNRASFTGLAPGTYTLCVRALDNGTILSPERTFTIRIYPPWYASWWAYILYSILAGCLIYVAINLVRKRIRERQENLNNQRLSTLNEYKLQFFINISHEIRTPMSLIMAPLEKLIQNNKDASLHKSYQIIYDNAQRILRLINQLMDIRKLDKGMMTLRFQKTEIVSFVKQLASSFEYQVQKRQINLNVIHNLPAIEVWIDVNNFDKVILNILQNALKYTRPNGSIDILIRTVPSSAATRSLLEIVIQDTGVGIEPDKINKIFERFYQISSELNQSNIGTGIGLHLSRELILLHHGNLWAENREDTSGSRFHIQIPLGNEHLRSDEIILFDTKQDTSLSSEEVLPVSLSETENRPVQKSHSGRTHILIVDDEDDIRSYLSDELSSKYAVVEAENGKIALDILLKRPIDLIVSDVMMPEMDGMTLCAKVRQNIHINHIPIILLTAKSGMDNKVEGMEVGADAYLVKPFNIDLLCSTIDNLINSRERLKNIFGGQQNQEDRMEKVQLPSADELFLERVMKVVNSNLDDITLNVEMIADNVGMSRVHVHRKLKSLTNQSARDLIRNTRLKQAAILLSEKKHSVADVAYATGFSNLSHFSTAFKELYGVSPKEWAAKSE